MYNCTIVTAYNLYLWSKHVRYAYFCSWVNIWTIWKFTLALLCFKQCFYSKHFSLSIHTIGLLAGIWPCGVIIMIDGLFLSENLSQVYGCLHGLFHTNPLTTGSIGMHVSMLIMIIKAIIFYRYTMLRWWLSFA